MACVSDASIAYKIVSRFSKNGYQSVLAIQAIAVTFAYCRCGNKGLYWNTILAAAWAGFIGIMIETTAVLVTVDPPGCPEDVPPEMFSLFIVAEPFWIVLEFFILI
eukprot:Pgem_evm1s9426